MTTWINYRTLLVVFATSLVGFTGRSGMEGSYTVRTMNGDQLPAELRIPTTEGDVRLFRLEQGVLTLKPGQRFTLHFRYYHQLVRRGRRPVNTPVFSESETGRYNLRADTLWLAATKNDRRRRPPIAATLAGDEIRASYLLTDRTISSRVTLVLRRDPRYW